MKNGTSFPGICKIFSKNIFLFGRTFFILSFHSAFSSYLCALFLFLLFLILFFFAALCECVWLEEWVDSAVGRVYLFNCEKIVYALEYCSSFRVSYLNFQLVKLHTFLYLVRCALSRQNIATKKICVCVDVVCLFVL